MKNQDEKLAKTRHENERLRNEIHNLKRDCDTLNVPSISLSNVPGVSE